MRFITERITSDVDLESFAGSAGSLFVGPQLGIATRGVAARISGRDARGFLSEVEASDEISTIGSGPLLIGAIPFDSTEPHHFILPEEILVRASTGECWLTTRDGKLTSEVPALDQIHHGQFVPRLGVSVEHYLDAVRAGREAVRRGDLTKVVIARDTFIDSDKPIDVHEILVRLRDAYPKSFRFSFDGLIGASPELLVSRSNHEISSHPLAGTTRRTGDPKRDSELAAELRQSKKNQIEHRVVIDMVHDTLLPHCSFLDWEPEPDVIPVGNVQHLGTRLIGHLSDPPLHVLDAAYALSPTPALGGYPRPAAIELIKRTEGFDRGRYGGAIGWFDRRGNGTFAVAIRCAEISADRRSAHLFAGGGIVADSEPEAELAETEAKLQAMTRAITGS